MIEVGELITALHHLAGYTEAREWSNEEKEKRGFNKNDCCGVLGHFSIDNPPQYMKKDAPKDTKEVA